MKKEMRNRLILQLVILMILGLAIYYVQLIIKYPLVGLEVNKMNGEWVVEDVYEKGWASHSGIQKGDTVYLVDGTDPNVHETVVLFNRVELAKTITTLNKDFSESSYLISYADLGPLTIFYSFVPIIFIAMSFFLGIFLYLAKKDDESIYILIYFLLSLGVSYLGAFASARGDLLGRISTTITFPGSLILFVHFIKSYFTRFNLEFIKDGMLKGLYIIYIAAMAVLSTSFFFPGLTSLMTIVKLAFFLSLLGYFLFLISRFYYRYKNSEGKNILKILWFTLFMTFAPFVIFYAIPILVFGKELLSAEFTAIFLLVIPVMFTYLLMAEKLFDIEFLLGRLRYYSWLSFPFAVAVSLLLWGPLGLGLFSKEMGQIILLIYCSSILFLYCKEFIDFKIRHHLFSQKSNYESSLYKFFQKAKYETKVSSLIASLANEIKDVLNVRDVYFIEIQAGNDTKGWRVKSGAPFAGTLTADIESVDWDAVRVGSLVELHNGFCLIIGEEHGGKSLLFCGLKRYRTTLNVQEKIWLETIAYFSSILLENFQLIEGLFQRIEDYKEKARTDTEVYPYWLSRLLFSLSEKERSNLSIDLHDSVLQDLLQLLREVELIQSKVQDPELKNDLFILKERMLDNIHMLRETCNELRPPFLAELGIIRSIQNLIEQTKLRSNFILFTELDSSIHGLDQEYELAIYRVVQELLNNAMKHSNASEVRVALGKTGKKVVLSYQDNGQGIDMKKLNDSFKTMGISGIKERIRSLGGTVAITSAPGKGLTVLIELDTGGNKK